MQHTRANAIPHTAYLHGYFRNTQSPLETSTIVAAYLHIIFVPENDDTGYELWIAQLGENQFGTTNRVDKQPAAGMMFSSANDRTWSAHQDKDIMFTIRRAQFLKNTEFTGHLVNRKQDWMNLTWGTGKPTTESFVSKENINGFSFTIILVNIVDYRFQANFN